MSTFGSWFLTDVQKILRNRFISDFSDPQLGARVRRNAAHIIAGDSKDDDNGF
jgi:hypothetical protein